MARVGRILVTGGGFCLSCVKIKRMGQERGHLRRPRRLPSHSRGLPHRRASLPRRPVAAPTPPCIGAAPPSASAAPRRHWRCRSSVWSAPSRETTAGFRSWTPLWTSSLRARPRPRAGRHQRTSPSRMSRTSGPGRMEWRRKREVGVSTVIFCLVLTRIHAGATWRATRASGVKM